MPSRQSPNITSNWRGPVLLFCLGLSWSLAMARTVAVDPVPRVKLTSPITISSCLQCHPGAIQYDFRSLSPEWLDSQ
ncbi:MAG: hypothetical protein GDA38_08215 [Hormoscilla sp. SP12CHS1]|nr:hypothetical protein [Hormoscilla sp. SP12CHS1]